MNGTFGGRPPGFLPRPVKLPYEIPTLKDFKEEFARDFPFGCSDDEVMDSDIKKAYNDVSFFMPTRFAADQIQFSKLFLLIAAHFLVVNLRASSQGVSGQYSWLQGSKGVGSVSEGIQIPGRIMENPQFAMLTKTNYGAKYFQLIYPQLIGNVGTVHGRIHP